MIEARIRKWGNSYGLLLPKNELIRQHLAEDEIVLVSLKKKHNIAQLFGICHFKRPVREIVREIREGYDD